MAKRRSNLGSAWEAKGQYKIAIKYYELALERGIINLGENHPTVATRRNKLGRAWQALGQYSKAIHYYDLALASSLLILGKIMVLWR